MSMRARPLMRGFVFGSLAIFGVATGCTSAGDESESLGSVAEGLRKGQGGVNCDGNYCKGSVLCTLGEGDCDLSSQCDQTTAAGPLVCVQNNGAKWGCAAGLDMCAPAHCTNRRLDPGETQVDCGGPCGTICPQVCSGLPANGLPGHCTVDCPCPSGQGDCNGNTTCQQGGPLGALVCPAGNGAKFGFSSAIEMCVPTHCTNNLLDAALGETSRDCGGDCGTVCATSCASLPGSGNLGHCTVQCPCPFGQGDCDLNTQCVPGGICLQDRGDSFGFAPDVDVCVAQHCSNGNVDGGETAIDCGGPDCQPCPGTVIDATRYGGNSTDYAHAIAADPAGNVYLAFRFVSSPFDIGLGNVGHAGESDILLAKVSPLGVPLWNRRFGNARADGDFNVALAVDASGNSYLVGSFYETVNLGGGDLTMVGENDVYLAKFDTNGGHVWSRSFGGPGVDRLRRVAVDAAGNLAIVGYFATSITLDGNVLTSAGSNDAYVAKVSSADGAVLWSRRFGSTLDDRAYGLATDNAGNIYVAGQIGGTVDLGLGSFTTSNGSLDAYLLKLDSSGVSQAATTVGGPSRGDMGATVGVDSLQRPVLAGLFTSTLDFGAGPFDPGISDVFVVAYDSNLATRRWAAHFGGPAHDKVSDFAVSSSGEVAVTGPFDDSIDLGSGTINATGQRDTYLVRLTSAGAVAWTQTFAGSGITEPMAMVLNRGTLYLSGYFNPSATFGTFSLGPSANASRDGFVTQLAF